MGLLSALALVCFILGAILTAANILSLLRSRPEGAPWTEVSKPTAKQKALSFSGFLLILAALVLNFFGSGG